MTVGVPRGRQTRPVREDDGLGRRGLPAACRRRPARPGACSRSATSASTTRSTRPPTTASSRRACWATSITRGSSGTATGPGAARTSRPRRDYDPSRWGYPDLRPPPQLAALLAATRKGLLAELASHQVNISNWFFGATPEAVTRLGRRLPLQGRARGPGPRLRHLRVSAGAHRDLLLHRVERLRRLLRDVHGHQGHAHPAAARPRPTSSRRAARRPGPRPWRSRPRAAGPALEASESPARRGRRRRGAAAAAARLVERRLQLSQRDLGVLRRRPRGHGRCAAGRTRPSARRRGLPRRQRGHAEEDVALA